MKSRFIYIIIILISTWPLTVHSQSGCQVPLSPVLTSVSVQPETGNTVLQWTPSPSAGIAAYVIYTYKDGTGMSLDTLWNPSATNYTWSSTASKYFSVSYVVAAHRTPDCTSPLSNPISSIFCSATIDTCKKELSIKWNSYTDVPKKVISYKIQYTVNGGAVNEITGIDKTRTSYTLVDFSTDAQYCFLVKAVLEGGSESSSNKSCLLTKMQRPPAWINADNTSVNEENKVNLSFTIDPASEIKLFRLERKTGQSGSWQQIAQPASSAGKVLYTDNQADAGTVNFYRLSALNNCNIAVTASNISSNIVLNLDRVNNDLKLKWNEYRKWKGDISTYRLFINTGNGFHEQAIIPSTDTTFTLDYSQIMYEVTGNDLCFYIEAYETANPYGIKGVSRSSRVCMPPIEVVTIPNIFTPNDDLVNDYFKPVLSFTPSSYQFVITDRKGKTLFESNDFNTAWDGKGNGNSYAQGVYLWYLKLLTPSGNSITRTGTVTIRTDK
jgi:gliding motility-associated-like protein